MRDRREKIRSSNGRVRKYCDVVYENLLLRRSLRVRFAHEDILFLLVSIQTRLSYFQRGPSFILAYLLFYPKAAKPRSDQRREIFTFWNLSKNATASEEALPLSFSRWRYCHRLGDFAVFFGSRRSHSRELLTGGVCLDESGWFARTVAKKPRPVFCQLTRLLEGDSQPNSGSSEIR